MQEAHLHSPSQTEPPVLISCQLPMNCRQWHCTVCVCVCACAYTHCYPVKNSEIWWWCDYVTPRLLSLHVARAGRTHIQREGIAGCASRCVLHVHVRSGCSKCCWLPIQAGAVGMGVRLATPLCTPFCLEPRADCTSHPFVVMPLLQTWKEVLSDCSCWPEH